MSESKHTPGKWETMQDLSKRKPDSMKPIQIVTEDGLCYPLAEVSPQPRAGEAEANARLIIAAPDMLAALDGILNGQLTGDVDTDSERFAFARAVVARAKGEAEPTIDLDKIEMELRDAWIGEGNTSRVTFAAWLRNMAENPRGVFQRAAKELRKARYSHAKSTPTAKGLHG